MYTQLKRRLMWWNMENEKNVSCWNIIGYLATAAKLRSIIRLQKSYTCVLLYVFNF